MASFLQKHRSATVYSVALHIAIAGTFLLGGIRFSSPSRAMPNATPIEAVLIDPSTVQAQLEKIAERERAERERQQERDRLAREAEETARLERERELERLATLQQEREQAEREAEERAVQLESQRQADEAERLAREAAAEAERVRQAELERQRVAEAERQAELDRQRREEEERLARERAAVADRQRVAAEAEARKQRELEDQLLTALVTEEEARRATESGLLDQYLRSIENQIQQRWIRPPTARTGLECIVNVTQIPSGDVTAVSIGRCNGDDAVIRSLEAAVLRASPLPRPPVPSLFNRNLVITFRPED
jgi:colicin import membrane protein